MPCTPSWRAALLSTRLSFLVPIVWQACCVVHWRPAMPVGLNLLNMCNRVLLTGNQPCICLHCYCWALSLESSLCPPLPQATTCQLMSPLCQPPPLSWGAGGRVGQGTGVSLSVSVSTLGAITRHATCRLICVSGCFVPNPRRSHV